MTPLRSTDSRDCPDCRDSVEAVGAAGAGEFRDAMRRWATGVAVVTTEGPGGPHGMTVNSLLSVSLDPPTLLISLKRGSRTLDAVERTGRFTVNVLAAGQRPVAERFTGRREVGEREFAGLRTRRSSGGGGPELEDCLAVLTCRTTECVEIADHTLVVAAVSRVRLPGEGGRPEHSLLYAGGRYQGLMSLSDLPDLPAG